MFYAYKFTGLVRYHSATLVLIMIKSSDNHALLTKQDMCGMIGQFIKTRSKVNKAHIEKGTQRGGVGKAGVCEVVSPRM